MTTKEELIDELVNGKGELEGLFERKRSSINMLTDPRVLAHLRTLHLQAQEEQSEDSSEELEESSQRDILAEKIFSFNRRIHMDTFKITLGKGVDYEGAVRFYFENSDGQKLATKAIRITNNTTVGDLLPILIDKFNLKKLVKEDPTRKRSIYQIIEGDEILLAKEEKPLDVALNSRVSPRFVFRMDTHRISSSPVVSKKTLHSPANKRRNLLSKFPNIKAMMNGHHTENTLRVDPSGELLTNGMLPLTDDSSLSSDLSSSLSNSSQSGRRDRTTEIKMNNGGASGLLINANLSKQRHKNKDSHVRSPAKAKARKHMKSSSSVALLFQRRFSLRKREKEEEETRLAKSVELSTEKATPGVLKVYGDQICPGAQYKSVLASMRSSAVELVKEVLERYGLSRSSYKDYVLCDVIGKFVKSETKGQLWMTECVRVVEDNERPLVLQSFWKPGEGFSRRFEVRKRSAVAEELGEIDTITSGINANARRLQLSRVRLHRAESNDALLDIVQNEERQPDLTSSVLNLDYTTTKTNGEDKNLLQRLLHEPEETESSDDPLALYNYKPPLDFPYFLTLRGFSPENDLVLYVLNEQVSMIGQMQEDDDEENKPDVSLSAHDILPQHCWVCKKPANRNYRLIENIEDCAMTVSLDPLALAKVTINGTLVTKETELKPGDLVAMGNHYVFLFKDPTTMKEIPLDLKWLSLSYEPNTPTIKKHSSVDSLSKCRDNLNEHLKKKAQEYERNENRIKMIYERRDEDDLLEKITSVVDVEKGGFTLTPAYLICMCVEYSAYHNDQAATRKLLLKISGLIQSIAWDKTKEIANKQPSRPNDAVASMKELLPDLQSIIFWMANALEMLNHFQGAMIDYLMSPAESLPPGSRASLATADDEVLSVLEEVVMYTFQQTVYYLTKTLYIALPAILDSNPFTDEEDNKDDNKSIGVDSVLTIFQSTFELISNLHVHPQIIHQLFAYLFFFTNASLFNMLMERGSGGKFYKWSKGAQIRGNLDLLVSWTQEHGLHQEAATFLRTLSSAADLLATPKVQLLNLDWNAIRKDFPSLNAAQVQQILSEYQLGNNKPRPRGWFPPPEDVEPALRTADILESFNNHPPLVLPNSDFIMDLDKPVNNGTFFESLQILADMLPSITIYTGTLLAEPQESADKLMASLIRKELAENDALRLQKTGYASVSHGNRGARSYEDIHRTSLSKGVMESEMDLLLHRNTMPETQKQCMEKVEGLRDSSDSQDDVFVVDLVKEDSGIGLGLIDGLYTPLRSAGIYVRTLLPKGAAARDGRLRLGDRILAVNGTSLVGADYQSAMQLIRNAGPRLRFLVAKSDVSMAMKITASSC
ncbi:ras-associating and dilute domain-containing protein-like [Glandiceps talaboti]